MTAEIRLPERDPTIVALAHRKQRFYLFTRREPAEGAEGDAAAVSDSVLGERKTKTHNANDDDDDDDNQ